MHAIIEYIKGTFSEYNIMDLKQTQWKKLIYNKN